MNLTCISDNSVTSLLGKGSYASVKLATHKETGMQVAIKIYEKMKINLHSEVRKSISREIKILTALTGLDKKVYANFCKGHPNIIRLFDAINTPR